MQKFKFFQQNISIYAIFNDPSFNDMFTYNIVSFEQLGPDCKNANVIWSLLYELHIASDKRNIEKILFLNKNRVSRENRCPTQAQLLKTNDVVS